MTGAAYCGVTEPAARVDTRRLVFSSTKGATLTARLSENRRVRVYARVESVDSEQHLVQLDCISADDQSLQDFLEETNQKLRTRWRVSFNVSEGSRDESMALLGNVPAAIVPIRIEDSQRWQEIMDTSTWIQLDIPAQALAVPATVPVTLGNFESVPSRLASKLDKVLDMADWPRVPAPQLSGVLSSLPPIVGAVVHDVGQGSANALFDGSGQAVVYFDAGRSKKGTTAPANLELCACTEPLVVLSHWDRDHWAAAEDGQGGLMTSVWVVPSQKIAGTHVTFAVRILNGGGSIFVVKRSSKPKNVNLGSHHIYIKYGTGTTRNDSGLVLTVNVKGQSGGRPWLFPGDALYSKCDAPPSHVDLLVASHHGANPKSTKNLPEPANGNDSRLVYSFGKHKGYNHPSPQAIAHHKTKKWDHANWDQTSPTGNVRGTNSNTIQNRQSIVFPPSALPLAVHFSTVHLDNLAT